MTLLLNRRVLAAKTEGTSGTKESLAAADAAFFSYDAVMQLTPTMNDRMAPNIFGTMASVPGGYSATCTFKTDLRYDGTTVPLWASTLLPACGYVESTSVFTPRSEVPGSNVKTITLGLYTNGKLRLMYGCSGTFSIQCDAGQPAVIEWTFTGVWDDETDVAILDPTYPTTEVPIRASGAATTFGGVSLCYATMRFDAGNDVQLIECPTTAAGFARALVVNRKPTITLDPEAKLVATRDTTADWLSMTERAFASTFGVSGTTFAIAAPAAQVVADSEANRKGLVTDSITLQCNKNGNTEDAEVSFTFG